MPGSSCLYKYVSTTPHRKTLKNSVARFWTSKMCRVATSSPATMTTCSKPVSQTWPPIENCLAAVFSSSLRCKNQPVMWSWKSSKKACNCRSHTAARAAKKCAKSTARIVDSLVPLTYSTRPLKRDSNALVAQLDRVPGYEPGGRWFESTRVHHIQKTPLLAVGFSVYGEQRW